MTQQQAIVLTKAMARVIKENRLSLETVLDYRKMRELFSITDLAAFVALQSHDVVYPVLLNSNYAWLNKAWARTATAEQTSELDSMVFKLSASEAVINHLRDQLFLAPDQELDPSATPVQVVDLSDNGIGVILDRGAAQYLSVGVNKFTVMRAVMQILQKTIPVSELALGEWFRKYMVLVAMFSPNRPPVPTIA